ncbi:transmembrane component STY3231 of energizing module of queuosine-regulated ECF transporter [Lachnospiraceae bacterium KM106-2]|nr:transmembrane component STY3231 of energizing module of queuosine-regulated ECF transporter [Lachnospiraceae bacterium KM106-2]
MKSISLYVDNGSYLTKIHPFTKLMYIVTMIVTTVLSGKLWVYGICIGLSALLLFAGKIFRKTLPLIAFSFTILITIFLIHGLFHQGNHNVLFQIGSVKFYKEGLLYASKIGLNILNLLLSFAVFVLSTKPAELVDEMEKKGMPSKFCYMISSVFQIIPQMTGTMHTIMDAQRSRGLETEGRLLTRMKAFLPLISPVVMSSLISTRERAIALEVRGFDSKNKKTYIEIREKMLIDRVLNGIMAVLIIGMIIWRVMICLL